MMWPTLIAGAGVCCYLILVVMLAVFCPSDPSYNSYKDID